MKVMIAESSYPQDFFRHELDGVSVASLLTTIRVRNQLRYVLDWAHFERVLREARDRNFDILHLSCHGASDGIALANNYQPSWSTFTRAFENADYRPAALVMSTCCGASAGLGEAFARQSIQPKIIFGSTHALGYSRYAVAWSILYHRLKNDGVRRDAAQTALRHIVAVSHSSFVYRRWDSELGRYRVYPPAGRTYEVTEVEQG